MVSTVALSKEKVTITLPSDLVKYAEQKAAELGTSRSRIIAEALGEKKARDEENLAAEGYRFYAKEASEFADSTLEAVSEALERAG